MKPQALGTPPGVYFLPPTPNFSEQVRAGARACPHIEHYTHDFFSNAVTHSRLNRNVTWERAAVGDRAWILNPMAEEPTDGTTEEVRDEEV